MKLTLTIVVDTQYVNRVLALIAVIKRWRDRWSSTPSVSIRIEGGGQIE